MKIRRIEIHSIDIPLHTPFRIATMETHKAKSLIVSLMTDQGLVGQGEACPTRRIAGETQAAGLEIARELGSILLGQDPLPLAERLNELDEHLAGNATIKSAYDMALYDILGQEAGLPLYSLLGGSPRPLVTDQTVGLAAPEVMAQRAMAIKESGFRAIKVKVGAGDGKDIDRVICIRQAVDTDIALRLDANQGWGFPEARAMLRAMELLGISFCEQPLARWDNASMVRLRGETKIPLMADESVFDHHDALALAAAGAFDLFNIKLAKSGIHKGLKVEAVAEAAGIGCMVGSMMETRLGLTAAAHLAAARPNIRYLDLDTAFMLAEDPVIGGIVYRADRIELPTGVGLGAALDPVFLTHCPVVVLE